MLAATKGQLEMCHWPTGGGCVFLFVFVCFCCIFFLFCKFFGGLVFLFFMTWICCKALAAAAA